MMTYPPTLSREFFEEVQRQMIIDPDKRLAHQSEILCHVFEAQYGDRYYILPQPEKPPRSGHFLNFIVLPIDPSVKVDIPGFK